MSTTTIEWTDVTWNPTVGCTVVSPGCANCYAQGQAYRQEHGFKTPGYEGTTKKSAAGQRLWTGKVNSLPDRLDAPLHWRKPARIFVNSMSDLFHEDVPDEYIAKVFGVMAASPQHTFQVLTKRPERMRRWFDWIAREGVSRGGPTVNAARGVLWYAWNSIDEIQVYSPSRPWVWPLPNVWLGVSVENQAAADERIPLLLQTPAAVRWLSCEPLLGPVDLTRVVHPKLRQRDALDPYIAYDALRGHVIGPDDIGQPKLDWVVVGGESGTGARPMHPDWARSLRDQCQASAVPFFFKQWGVWLPGDHYTNALRKIDPDQVYSRFLMREWEGEMWCVVNEEEREPCMYRVGKKAAGRQLDGREWNEYPGVRHG